MPKVRGTFGPGIRNVQQPFRRRPHQGEFMATATAAAPTREDFAKLLEESFTQGGLMEGTVVKGTVVGLEKDVAVIDVGAKTEGRVAIREFTGPGRQGELKVGDTVEVYLERVENALGEAVLSRDKVRPGPNTSSLYL
jgi:small subunit ribosomal protein S1